MRRRVLKAKESEFEKPLFLQLYSGLAADLRPLFESYAITETFLSKITYQILNFMETHFGRDAANPKAMTKLPAKLFRTYDSEGPLFYILREAISEMRNQAWQDFDLAIEENVAAGKKLLQHISNLMIEKKFFSYPKVFFFDNVNADTRAALAEIVTNHSGSVVDDQSLASHIVEWNEELDGPNDVEEGFIRPIKIRPDGLIVVHHWYYPDCYDESITADEVDSTDEIDESVSSSGKQPWRVSCRFIQDCEYFNEWGNELDYEVEETPVDISSEDASQSVNVGNSARKGSIKRSKTKRRSPETSSNISIKKESTIAESVPVTDKMFADVPPSTLRDNSDSSSSSSSSSSSANICDISIDAQGTTHISSLKRKVDGDSASSSSPEVESKKPRPAAAGGKELKYPRWFSSDSVSPLEARYMPDLIMQPLSTASPENANADYLKLRSEIIAMSSINPGLYLSATECRQKIAGDVGAIIAIHEFLDAFGIINRLVKSDNRPTPSIAMFSDAVSRCASGQNQQLSFPPSAADAWTKAADSLLIRHVSEHGNEWSKISILMKDSGFEFSATQCLSRFVRMTNIDLYGKKTIDADKALAMPTAETDEGGCEKTNFCVQQLTLTLKDYLDIRLKIMEQKMALVTELETILSDERERLEIESRDVAIQKAQLSFSQQSILSNSIKS